MPCMNYTGYFSRLLWLFFSCRTIQPKRHPWFIQLPKPRSDKEYMPVLVPKVISSFITTDVFIPSDLNSMVLLYRNPPYLHTPFLDFHHRLSFFIPFVHCITLELQLHNAYFLQYVKSSTKPGILIQLHGALPHCIEKSLAHRVNLTNTLTNEAYE